MQSRFTKCPRKFMFDYVDQERGVIMYIKTKPTPPTPSRIVRPDGVICDEPIVDEPSGWHPNLGESPSDRSRIVEIETVGGNIYVGAVKSYRWARSGAVSDIRHWRYVPDDTPKMKGKLPDVPLPVFDKRPIPDGDTIMDIVDQMSRGC